MKIRILAFLAFIFIFIGPLKARATDLYALMDPGDGRVEYNFYLSYEKVDGIALRLRWAEIEPKDNVYNWNKIDDAVKQAYKYRKGLTLHILPSSYVAPPSWLEDAGMEEYRASFPLKYGRSNSYEPVPWDKVYLEKWEEFMAALAEHLNEPKALASLKYISVAAPVPEMSLIYCRDNKMSSSLGYSREWYLYSWKKTIEIMRKYFPRPTKLLPVPVDQICRPDNDGPAFFSEVYRFAGAGFMPFATDLNGYGSKRLKGIPQDLYNASGLQFIWQYTIDPKKTKRKRFAGELKDGVCKGVLDYKGDYFEVYQDDLNNTDFPVRRAIQKIKSPASCD